MLAHPQIGSTQRFDLAEPSATDVDKVLMPFKNMGILPRLQNYLAACFENDPGTVGKNASSNVFGECPIWMFKVAVFVYAVKCRQSQYKLLWPKKLPALLTTTLSKHVYFVSVPGLAAAAVLTNAVLFNVGAPAMIDASIASLLSKYLGIPFQLQAGDIYFMFQSFAAVSLAKFEVTLTPENQFGPYPGRLQRIATRTNRVGSHINTISTATVMVEQVVPLL